MLKIQQNPLCQICEARGLIEPATEVHHIKSILNTDGTVNEFNAYNWYNLLSCCTLCHSKYIHAGGRTDGLNLKEVIRNEDKDNFKGRNDGFEYYREHQEEFKYLE